MSAVALFQACICAGKTKSPAERPSSTTMKCFALPVSGYVCFPTVAVVGVSVAATETGVPAVL